MAAPKGPKDTNPDLSDRLPRRRPTSEFDQVPDADDFLVQEPTPVRDMNQETALQAMGEIQKYTRSIAKSLNAQSSYVAQIPYIRKAADDAKIAAEALKQDVLVVSTKLGDVDRRVERIEDRPNVSHDCFQVGVIAKVQDAVQIDVYEGGRTKEKLLAVESTVKDTEEKVNALQKTPMKFMAAVLTTIIAFVGSAMVVAWKASALNTQIENDRARTTQQIQDLSMDIKAVPQKSVQAIRSMPAPPSPTQNLDDWCRTLSEDDITRIKTTIPTHRWPKCARLSSP